jgi:Sulfotransferase domain
LHHLTDAWRRRAADPVRLVHYDDLCTDLGGQMRALAAWLEIDVCERAWPELVAAAEFSSMRARADQLVPARGRILKDNAAFFRRGRPRRRGRAARRSRTSPLPDQGRTTRPARPSPLAAPQAVRTSEAQYEFARAHDPAI